MLCCKGLVLRWNIGSFTSPRLGAEVENDRNWA